MRLATIKATNYFCSRLSRDEKLFNRDLEQALAKSEPSQPEQEPTLNDSDYMPGSIKHSDSDEDFELSPPVKKQKKSTEGKKSKKKPSKTATQLVPTIKCEKVLVDLKPSANTVKSTDLPGSSSKPVTGLQAATKTTSSSVPVGRRCDKLSVDLKPSASAVTSTNSGLHTATKTAVTPGRRKGTPAKWVPPARVGDNTSQTKGPVPNMRSSGGGAPVIRVGLSRKAPIKPLHSIQSPPHTKN